MPGFSGPRTTSEPESVTALLNFLRIDARLVEHEHRALRGPARGRHLPVGCLEVHDPRADRRDPVRGAHERVAEAGVEAVGDVAHQLDVLALVIADRHLVGAVGEHVGGLEHRVEEEARGDELALCSGLLLELVHAVQLAPARHRAEQPAQLRVFLHVALAEEDAATRVETRREQDRRGVVRALAQFHRVVGHGRRVHVDDAVDRDVAGLDRPVLACDVLRDRTDVVAEVLAARGLDAGEDAHSGAEGIGK